MRRAERQGAPRPWSRTPWRRLVPGAALLLTGAVLGSAVTVQAAGLLHEPAAATTPAHPTAGRGAAASPLGRAPVVEPADGNWRPARVQVDGTTPVAWDPCRPVHVVTRPQGAPPGADALLADVLARMSAVTGLRFVHEGSTDEDPSPRRRAHQPERYGDRWAPVLLVWTTAQENPDFAASRLGQASPRSVDLRGHPSVYVSGVVELDAAKFGQLLDRPDGRERARAVLLHEFAHLAGLDHVNDPRQLLYAVLDPQARDFGPGDLTGLAELGRGACVPQL